MRPSRNTCRLAGFAGACISALAGCTYGTVTDASTGTPPGGVFGATPIPGAKLTFLSLDTSTQVVIETAPAVLKGEALAPPSVQTWTAAELAATSPPSPTTYAGDYWVNPYSPKRPSDTTGALLNEGWTRFAVSAPGFDTAYAYRNHQYVQGAVDETSPYSGPGPGGQAPYAAPPSLNNLSTVSTLPGFPTLVANENFALWRTTLEIPGLCFPFNQCIPPIFLFAHPLLPDLIVDVRSLLPTPANAQTPSPQEVGLGLTPIGLGEGGCCASIAGSSLPSTVQECLAFPLNMANVGSGRFELLSNSSTLGAVTQVTYDTSGQHTINPTTGSMITALPGGFHVSNFVAMRIRGPIVTGCLSSPPVAGCCDTEATASACPVVSSGSKAVCLDLDGVFDQDIFQAFSGGKIKPALTNSGALSCQGHANGQVVPNNVPNAGIDMGLEPGYAAMYSIGNFYQFLDITNVAPGSYWLEAEINPADANGVRTYMESNTTNNISRAQIAIVTPPEGGGGTRGPGAGCM